MSNQVAFWELASHDQDRSAEFFRDVFGWDCTFDDKLGFYRVKTPMSESAGNGYIFTLRKAKLPFVALYIRVEDIQEKKKLVEEHGGFIVLEPQEVVPGTTICLFNEPSGVTFAMVEERSPGQAG